MTYIDTLGQQAKVAGRQIAKLSTAAKNDLLNQVAKALVAESAYIITEIQHSGLLHQRHYSGPVYRR